MSTRIHIGLPVSDLAASVGFYEAAFGHAASKRKSDYANFRLDEPPLMLALVAGSADRVQDPGPAGPRHYGVELPSADALAAWLDRARAAGLAVREEKAVTCCYARADKFWLRDPDGNAWEFWHRTGDAETMHEPPR